MITLLCYLTFAYAHDLHQVSEAVDKPVTLIHVSYVAATFTYRHIYLEDSLDISYTGTMYNHVSDPSGYDLPEITYEKNYFPICIGYDYQTVLQGPFLNQNHPIIAQIALYTQQNIMLKHDFLTVANLISYLKYMMFCDTSHSQFHSKQQHKVLHKSIIPNKSPSTLMLGGGKVPRSKEEIYTSTTGSNFFAGDVLLKYACFTLEKSELLSVQQPEVIAGATYKLLHIIPKELIEEFSSQVDLVCCIPLTCILSRLTKKALFALPYASDGIVYRNISRARLIAHVENKISQHTAEEYYSLFKVHKISQNKFPNKDLSLRQIQPRGRRYFISGYDAPLCLSVGFNA